MNQFACACSVYFCLDSCCLLFCLFVCCLDDEVYLSDEDKRQEYVLNESGLIWAGTHRSTFTWPWNFAQVHGICADVHTVHVVTVECIETSLYWKPLCNEIIIMSQLIFLLSYFNLFEDNFFVSLCRKYFVICRFHCS